MTDLRNVWIRSLDGHLLRADRIVSLSPAVGDTDAGGGVSALVPVQDGMRALIVLDCRREISTRAAGELALMLGKAVDDDHPALFVFPSEAGDDRFQWEMSAEPPDD
jgi:hypothetical protein